MPGDLEPGEVFPAPAQQGVRIDRVAADKGHGNLAEPTVCSREYDSFADLWMGFENGFDFPRVYVLATAVDHVVIAPQHAHVPG